MTIFQAIILGVIQGLTEFIPISSSAHLIIVPWIFDWNNPGLSFDIALHLGTLAALVWYFANDFIRIIRAGIASIVERKIGNYTDRKLAWLLVIGSIPGVCVGILAENKIEEWFHQPGIPILPEVMIAMAIVIILLGLLLFIAERSAKHRRELERVSLKDTIIVGFAQALSIFPGVSRSGSTITGGLFAGLKREDAARFSFLLGAPIIFGAGAMGIINVYDQVQIGSFGQNDLILFLTGFITATVSGYLCIKFLLRYLQNNTTDIFVYYRWVLAIFIIAMAIIKGQPDG